MPFDFALLNDHVDGLGKLRAGPERGAALEDLVADMLATLPGVTVVRRNASTFAGDQEIDIVLANDQHRAGLRNLQPDVLVECKSTLTPVSSRDIGWFIDALNLRRHEWGILVALGGLTGQQANDRAAAHVVSREKETGRCGLIVLQKTELLCLRSAQHLSAVIDHKRRVLANTFVPAALDEAEMAELQSLDPGFKRGPAAMRDAIREMRAAAVDEILDRAAQRSEQATADEVRHELDAVQAQVSRNQEDPDRDPMWRAVHAAVVDSAASFLGLLEELPREPEDRRIVRFEAEWRSPRRLEAWPGSELWALLMDYYLRQAAGAETRHQRVGAIHAAVALAAEAIMGIDDIEPPEADEEYP